ncbi:hypothetical protein D3C81_1852630 [compost metagenome]
MARSSFEGSSPSRNNGTPSNSVAGYRPVVAPTYKGLSSDGRFRSMTNREYSAARVLAPSSAAKS